MASFRGFHSFAAAPWASTLLPECSPNGARTYFVSAPLR